MPHGEQLSASDERCPSRPHDRGGDAILGQLRLEPLEDPDGLRAHAKHAQPHQHKETKAPVLLQLKRTRRHDARLSP